MKPDISIISTNFNNAMFLEDMVTSVQEQDFNHWELIIVDDCSTDKSRSVLDSLKRQDKRIKTIFLSQNVGPAKAFNIGLKEAKAKIIGRLDSDDALESVALRTMLEAHSSHPSASLICSHAWECDLTLKRIRKWPGYSAPKHGVSLIECCTIGAFATFKIAETENKEVLDGQLRRAVDLDLYLKLEESGEVIFIDTPLYLYRQHTRGISQNESGIRAFQWARFVRLNAHVRRMKNRKAKTLTVRDLKSLSYAWFVTELVSGEMGMSKFEIWKKTLAYNWRILFNPKAYTHLFFS